MKDEHKEALWKWVEKWSIPLLLVVFVCGGLWHFVVQPKMAAMDNTAARAAGLQEQEFEEAAREVEEVDDYIDDARNARANIDELLQQVQQAQTRDGRPAVLPGMQPAAMQLAGRLAVIAALLLPKDADALVSKMDDDTHRHPAPATARITRERRTYVAEHGLHATEYLPLIPAEKSLAINFGDDAGVGALTEDEGRPEFLGPYNMRIKQYAEMTAVDDRADPTLVTRVALANRCAMDIVRRNIDVVTAAAAILDQEVQSSRPDWNQEAIDGSTVHVRTQAGYEMLKSEGPLKLAPRGDKDVPEWCRTQ